MVDYLNAIDSELRQNKEQLTTESFNCPKTLPLETIDKLLKEFVHIHQRRFTRKIKCYMAQFRGQIRDYELWQELSAFGMTIEQVK